MQPEDVSGGLPVGDEGKVGQDRGLDSWVGRRVEVVLVRPINPDQPKFSTSLTAFTYKGLLEQVLEHGILASVSSDYEMLAANTFYPWGSVLSMRLAEDQV
jgi:hypothetical protein